MGIVTDIKLNKAGTRAKIYIDGEYCTDIAVDTAYKYDIKNGVEMDADKLDDIIYESEKIICVEYLIQYLSKYPCSEKKARLKLKEKGYSPRSIDNSIETTKEYGYINDYDFALRYAESKSSKSGVYKIKTELYRLGIDNGIVAEVLSELDESAVFDGAMQLARKWWRTRDIEERSDKNKFANYMNSRGYDWSLTGKCIEAIKREETMATDDGEE